MKLVLASSAQILINAHQANGKMVEAHLPVASAIIPNQYNFFPISTIIGLSFIVICFLLLAVAKIMFTSSAQYMANNRYDLVIFKPPSGGKNDKDKGPRRVYTNVSANSHNISAAKACGFDVSMLNTRNPLTALSALSNTKQT
jgi:hypothetical protein